MTEKPNINSIKTEYTNKEIVGYSLSGVADTLSYQMFSFYIFNYYIAVKQLPVLWIIIGFMIWTVWNAINDPLIGILSDRSTSKYGRRRPFIVLGLLPLIAIIILLWTPFGNQIGQYIYFIIIILAFDTFYTLYSVNQVSLFPEMFQNLDQRAKANNYRQIFNIIGLLFAAIIPTLFVPTSVEPGTEAGYFIGSIIMAILAAVFGLLFVKFGLRERVEYSKDPLKAPSFKDSIKFTLKNKAFRSYVVVNLCVWYIFGLVPIINPYYARFILGVEGGFGASIYLAILFISAMVFTIPWSKIFAKYGPRKAEIYAIICLIFAMSPFLFMLGPILAIFTYIIGGFGFAGIMFGRDILMSTVIDTDEIDVGLRREASYYGVNALIIRFSTIAVYLSVFFIFWGIGWGVIYDPSNYTPQTDIGIFILIYFLPVIAMMIGLLAISRFPVTKERYDEMQKELDRIHDEKAKMVDLDEYNQIL
ncbi:MAG: putative Major facilitator superfamily transporter [Promethearchaeota archaeon]|nr:MAG: putative Major facilitator superfamily transporter [Candidatus Lokiarchaeota archaeon]